MSKLELMQCKTCGGHIDRATLTCQSCGAMYRLNEDNIPIRLEVSQMRIETIVGSAITPREAIYTLGEKGACEMTLKEMASHMAEKLLPFIEYQTEYDFKHNEYVTYGRIRVANPHR